jgi:hypothetical protein
MWSASSPGRFTPGERAPIRLGEEAGWTPEPVWTTWRKFLTLLGLELRLLGRPTQPVAIHSPNISVRRVKSRIKINHKRTYESA